MVLTSTGWKLSVPESMAVLEHCGEIWALTPHCVAAGTKPSGLGMFFTWCSVLWEMIPAQRGFPERRDG